MAGASPFTFYCYDLLSGALVGAVPGRAVQFGQQLNTAVSGQFTLDITDPRVQAANPIQCTIPNRTLLVVDYQGTLVWAGIVLTRRWNVSASGQGTTRALDIGCSELWSYFQQRVQATDYSAPPSSGIQRPPIAALTAPTGLAVLASGQGPTRVSYWQVTAYNSFGETTGSAEVSAAVPVVNSLASLSWTPVAGAVGYKVYRSSASGGEPTTPAVVGSTTTAAYNDTLAATSAGAVPASNTTGSTGATMPLWPQNVWDACLIACQVIEDAIGYAQGITNPFTNLLGGLRILLNGALPSGSTPVVPVSNYVAVNYPYTTTMTVETIVGQLAQLGLGTGFDFGVDLAYSGGPGSTPVATINLSYPRRGLTVAQNGLTIDLTSARQYEFPEDGSQTANQVYEIGGSGAISVAENVFPLDQGYPLWERVISRSQAQSQNIIGLLGQAATADLAMYSYAPVAPTVTLGLFDGNLPLGSFSVGDDIRVLLPAKAGDGGVFDARFPAGLDQEWRIVGWQADLKDEGDPTLQLTLNQPPYLQALAAAV